MDALGLPARLRARLTRGRAAAEARMGAVNGASDCAVMRAIGRLPQNDSAGFAELTEWATVYPDLPCRVAGARGSATSRTLTAGNVEVEASVRAIHFPALTDLLEDGDLVLITAGENTGRVYRLVETDWQDQATAQRFPAVATQRPEEWTA